jgi:hypothetical protein
MLKQTYGEDCLSLTPCYEWYQHFKLGRASTKDNLKTGRPSTSMDDDYVEKVYAMIRENRHLTVRKVFEEVGITKSLCHTILTKELEMHCVAAKFVPCLLTDEQKSNYVTVNQELFDHSNADKNFLKNVITGNEMCVYRYDIETKVQLSQWVGKSSP